MFPIQMDSGDVRPSTCLQVHDCGMPVVVRLPSGWIVAGGLVVVRVGSVLANLMKWVERIGLPRR